MKCENPRKILLIRFSSLGDIVMTTAAIRCLKAKFPSSQIDMVVRADFLDLIKENPHLTHKFSLDRKSGMKGMRELYARLNAEAYDLVVDVHRSLRSRLLMPLISSKAKAYYKKHYVKRAMALTFKAKSLLDRPRFLEQFLEPLGPWGVEYDGKGPEIFVDAVTSERAFSKIGLLLKGKELVGIIPTAQWPGKRWAIDRFSGVVGRLSEKGRYHFVVFGGKGDNYCDSICAENPTTTTNARGRLTIL